MKISELSDEFALLTKAWDAQQSELEALRLSLKVRTAQRDDAEQALERAQTIINKLVQL